jgi:hypothetical protein
MLVPAASPVLRPLTLSCWRVTLLAALIVTPTGLPVIVATLVVEAVRSQLLVELQPPSMLMLLSALPRVRAPSANVLPPEAAATATTLRPAPTAALTPAAIVNFGEAEVRPVFESLPVDDTKTVLVGFSSMKNVTVPGLDCAPEVSVAKTVNV